MSGSPSRRGLLLSVAVAAGVLGALFALDHREAREAGAQTVLGSLPSLRAHAGEDPRAGYARLRIPSIGVDAPIGAHAVTAAGAVMPNPFGPADVAWYDFEAHAFGGAVGLGQNAVMSGHVDYAANVAFAGVRYHGPGVFARLGELRTGDVIEVDRGGKTYRYAVSWTRLLPGEPTPAWGEVLTRNVPVESVTLYTCDGTFNAG
ncbi:MAG: class F sortase, partial [Dehalococcoidia bacterium]